MNDIIDRLCGIMVPDTHYGVNGLKLLAKNNNLSEKKIISLVNKDPRILTTKIGSKKFYYLNPKFDFKKERTLQENISVTNLAETILNIILKQIKSHILKWIDSKFERSLDESVQRYVRDEFKS